MTTSACTLLCAGALALAAPAAAGPLTDSLKARQSRVDAILARNPGTFTPEARKQLGDALAGAFDFTAMGRAALASWDQRSEAERTQYVAAFEQLIRASLVRRPDIYRVKKVDYTVDKVTGDTGHVDTVVTSKDATTEVAYDFVRSGAAWRISDYAIDGVSTARNYRSQFTRLVAKNGWAGLLERIRKRTAEIEKEIAG